MALALQESTTNSLVIVDEFGKGTSGADGLALLAASLNTLLFRAGECPHVLLSTHFLKIKDYIVDTPIVRFLKFEHIMDNGEPVFLFRVSPGSSDASLARAVAAASGVGAAVVDRASSVLEAMMNNTLPSPNKKITTKLKNITDIIKAELLAEEI